MIQLPLITPMKRLPLTVGWFALFYLFLFNHSGFADSPVKRALLIGIDEYQAVSDLRGCVNDIEMMRSILIGKFDVQPEHIALLKNEEATRQGIIETIQSHLIDQAQPGDVVILHYSGHGSQMRDQPDGDEIDGMDETIVPHDSRTERIFDITDDEINGLLGKLTERTKNVTFILDSCHSGAAARAGNKVRMVEADSREPPPESEFSFSTRAGEGDAGIRLNGADYVLISGCLATELSNETQFGDRRHGAMTWFLASALNAAQQDATYRSVMDNVRANVNAKFPSQHPQIEGPGMDLKVFGTDKINSRPYVLVKQVNGNSVHLDGGEVLGLHVDSRLKIYPPGTSNFDDAESTALVRVIAVDGFSAQTEIVEGGPVQQNAKALIEFSSFSDTPTTVYMHPSASESLVEISRQLTQFKALELVKAQDAALLIVKQQDGFISVQSGDLQQIAPPVSVAEAGHIGTVVNQIKDIVHWRTLRDLTNPDTSLRVEFDIETKDTAAVTLNPSTVAPGEHLIYQVKNVTASTPLFPYVLDVSSDGSVALLYPPIGEQQALAPGAELRREIEVFLPEGLRSTKDVFKVIATTNPIDPSVFPQGSMRSAPLPQGTRAGNDPLSKFLANATRATRAARPVNVDTWITRERTVIIQPPVAKTSGFTLHFDEPASEADVPRTLGASRSVCSSADGSDPADCLKLQAMDQENKIFELDSIALQRSEEENRSIGAIFDEAYQIQLQTGAVRVEPNLEVDAPGIVDQQGIDKREILGDSGHDDAATNDDRWSLKQIQVEQAWQKIRNRFGVAEGQEGSGILVAHTDTGFRKHPENWQEIEGKRPIDPDRGYDYYDGDDDPTDPLLSSSKLDNPGHGTASGSVIVSPKGCQLDNTPGCVNGVARGAQLIPLRVNRTVSQFNTSNLAQAIRDVADGKIDGKPPLISTAMGGPPSFNLYRAVKSAEQSGVLMVAAAGNYVRTVVWPARFQSTIAAAAVNVRCQPWKHSSRGNSVDISAPGESVWRATLNKDGEYINYMGKGTTFATGNTAAAAALWLAWHRDNPELKTLQKQGLVTRSFRNALEKSAWKPTGGSADPEGTHCADSEWDSAKFGPGIIDINALLEVPLGVAESRSLTSTGSEIIPLFASLYPENTPTNQIVEDYRSLLGAAEDVSLDDLKNFETEIMYHFTLDTDTQRTIDAIVQGQRSNEPIERARHSLLNQDLSLKLRTLLKTGA